MKNLKVITCVCLVCTIFFNCKDKTKQQNVFKGRVVNSLKLEHVKEIKKNNGKLKTIMIPEGYTNTISVSEIVDSCFYVPLETKSNCIIGKIDEIKFFENKILILDTYKAKAVYMFDNKGHFIRKIGATGKGPGEYLFPQDFDIDKLNQEVLIFNGNASKIYRYNFNGDFLGDINLPVRAYSFSCLENGQIMIYSGDYENEHLDLLSNMLIYGINRKGEIINFIKKNNDYSKNINMSLLNNSLVSNEIISFSPILSDTIFKIENKNVLSQYFIDFEKKSFPKNQVKELNTEKFLDYVDKYQYPYFLGNHLQNNNYLYFNLFFKNSSVQCFFNKNNNKLLIGDNFKFDNLDYLAPLNPIGIFKDYFVGSITPLELIDKKKIVLNNPQLLTLIKSKHQSIKFLLNINENDNPVIVFYKLK